MSSPESGADVSELDVIARARHIARQEGSLVIRRHHLARAERELGVTVKVER